MESPLSISPFSIERESCDDDESSTNELLSQVMSLNSYYVRTYTIYFER